MLIRYSRWDGTQQVDSFSADDIMQEVADEILAGGDLNRALQRLLQRGAQFPGGHRMMGLQEILERLRDSLSQRLSQYNLDSVLDEIKERLEKVIETERSSVLEKLDGGPQTMDDGPQTMDGGPADDGGANASADSQAAPEVDPKLRELRERMARKRLEQLDNLPPDVGGKIKELREYDFLDQDARQQFEELLKMLQQQVMQTYFRGMQQSIQNMTPEMLQQVQRMLHDLNRMIEQRRRGEEPDFQEFKKKWGHFFPPDINSLDELTEHLQRQMAQMQSLLDSMTPEMRRELEQMLDSLFQDPRLQQELGQLAAHLRSLYPMEGGEEFPFAGDDPLTLEEAMRLMGDMQGLDQLERELTEAMRTNDASRVEPEEVSRLIDEEARDMLRELQQLAKRLEEAGLIQRRGKEWELTPLALRKIGQRALQDIFNQLKTGVFGNHNLDRRGVGAERLDETRTYVFGDPFLIDAQRSVFNALLREGPGKPVRMRKEDFEVYGARESTQCSTVIMLDMSYSMMMGGRFQAGRKVALALDSLIRSQFPRDSLDVVAFSYFVLRLSPEMLLDSYWVEYGGGTNFQEALRQGRMILGKRKLGTKQIIMITDGEPTTYSYASRYYDADDFGDWDGHRRFRGGLEETLREVVRCKRDGITVNTFMLARDRAQSEFVRVMAKLNQGRVFYSSPSQLGEYVLVDYLSNRRRVESSGRTR